MTNTLLWGSSLVIWQSGLSVVQISFKYFQGKLALNCGVPAAWSDKVGFIDGVSESVGAYLLVSLPFLHILEDVLSLVVHVQSVEGVLVNWVIELGEKLEYGCNIDVK